MGKFISRSLMVRFTGTACLTIAIITQGALGVADPTNRVVNARHGTVQSVHKSIPISKGPTEITNIRWFSDRRVEMWVYSHSMDTTIPVQLLLARDWNYQPLATFPSLYLLDGIEARDNQNGWLLNTNAEQFFKDKNVNVVLPIGGKSSFYTDWKRPDHGRNYQWETFLVKELPPLLELSWRTNSLRGIEGLSMGGTAAMTLAARNPGFYTYAGSFSGMLDLTTVGMPLAVQVALRAYGNFDSANMYGLPSNPAWAQHDPISLAENLRGTSLYVSSGSGLMSKSNSKVPNLNPSLRANPAIIGVEMFSRVSSERFVSKLDQLSIPVQAVFRSSGTHSWPYWQFEMQRSWPQVAQALSATAQSPCVVRGAIATIIRNHRELQQCLTPEYDISGGRAQDFINGRVIWSRGTGAHIVDGPIGGAYIGSSGYLGFPVDDGRRYGKIRVQKFTKGEIVWSEHNGAHPIHGAILAKWRSGGAIGNPIGLPIGDETATPDDLSRVQEFDNGSIYYSAGTGAHPVMGFLYIKYAVQKYEQGLLGLPISDARTLGSKGLLQKFAGGNLYQTEKGVFAVPNGSILAAWGELGYESGHLGYPISDIYLIPGGSAQKFENGTITVINGMVNYSV